jgi:two-component system cell cycle response regulator
MHILIADDNPIHRALLKGLLAREGHQVTIAKDGLESWNILQRSDAPRLAILDWQMPGMNGLEVCDRLRKLEHKPYVFVILLTANDQPHQLLQGLRAGADDYMTKPLDAALLRAKLEGGQRILQLQANFIAAEEKLRFQVDHDFLTGMYNRAGIIGLLDREIARAQRSEASFGVVICDLDHFKLINDTHGHASGDHALCEVARRLSAKVRSYDAVGRLGGEEFLILLPGCDGQSSLVQAERLRQCVAESPLDLGNGLHLSITASFGAASFDPANAEEAADLVARADVALYEAKTHGRNRVELSQSPECKLTAIA